MAEMQMCKTSVIHVRLYAFIPKVIGSRFRPALALQLSLSYQAGSPGLGQGFKPALARLDMHSWHDLIECCARSFYAMGQESQTRPGATCLN